MVANEPSIPKHPLPLSIPEGGAERYPTVFRGWYPAAWASDLRRDQLLKCVIYGREFVVYRLADSRVAALIDRCPHRNVPLSGGKIFQDGTLECPYHGWRFSADGVCRAVPGLATVPAGISAISVPILEAGGLVWVWADPTSPPGPAPKIPEITDTPAYTSVRLEVEAPASLYRAAENALDVPHTSILHRGLFRAGGRQKVQVIVRRSHSAVEAEYRGERAPEGLLARVLAAGLPKSERDMSVQHWDRFLLPATIEVEYKLGLAAHFLITAFARPVSSESTVLYVISSFRTSLPGWLVRAVLEPAARFVFRQDRFILAAQSGSFRRQGAPRYHSTVLDSVGQEIWRLLKAKSDAEKAEKAEEPQSVSEGQAAEGQVDWVSEKQFELLA